MSRLEELDVSYCRREGWYSRSSYISRIWGWR